MRKINWVNFLHIYQPPWQQRGVIEQVASESYEYLLKLFQKYPKFKATLNISGSLIEQLALIRPDLLQQLQHLVKQGQIELVGSAKYHALLPLLTDKEIRRQIKLNQEILADHFSLVKINGFYFPEMAFSLPAAKIVKSLGFKWIILDPISYQGQIDNHLMYQLKQVGLKVVLRNREISKNYPAEVIFYKLKEKSVAEIIITATDGEIYGHFHKDWQGCLEKSLQDKNLRVMTVGQYLLTLKRKKAIELRVSSWESTAEELRKNKPFILWDDPKNKIHQSLWRLVDLVSHLVNRYSKDKNWFWARRHLDRGLSSCTFWWASSKKPSPFSPFTWNPDMIDNGAEELIRSVRSLEQATSQEKIKAEKLYIEIKKNTWLTHWRKYNRK